MSITWTKKNKPANTPWVKVPKQTSTVWVKKNKSSVMSWVKVPKAT